MKEQKDLRVTKTYRLLAQAFAELLEEKSFEDISVKELCDRAMIRRTTFYKHFSDKYEYLAFYIRQMRDEFYHEDHPKKEESTGELFLRMASRLVRFLNEKEAMVRRVLSSNMPMTLLDALEEQIEVDITEQLREEVKNGKELPVSAEFYASFCVGGYIRILRLWLTKKETFSEEEVLESVKLMTSLLI
ncbi:MAG: TetR/AcrR family transcriptional regulator [Clostridia bacterium]